MTDRKKQGREYVADVLGRPWAEVAAALNKLELDPKRLDNPVSREIGHRAWAAHALSRMWANHQDRAVRDVYQAVQSARLQEVPMREESATQWEEAMRKHGVPEELIGKAGAVVTDSTGETVYEHVVGPVHPYFHGPDHGEHFHRSEYFNQVIDPDAGPVPPGTEPCP